MILSRKRTWVALLASTTLLFTTAFAPVDIDFSKDKKPFKKIKAERIYKDIAHLANKDDARVAGTEGEKEAAEFVAKRLRRLGYEVEMQQFPFTSFADHGSSIALTSPESKNLESKAFTYSPATPEGGLSGSIVYAELGSAEDFSRIDVEGKIALIKRGSYSFYDKVQNAANAGAIGAIIFNHSEGLISGTLGSQTDIPALALSDVDGNDLLGLLESGEVQLTLNANTETIETYSQNVIANKKARKKAKDPQTLIVGAHYDGVDTPAANDNASGTATLLEVARVLAKKKLDHNLRFVAFGAEEAGLIGAYEYVDALDDAEKENISGMLNMDMVGVGDTLNLMTGEEDAVSWIADDAAELAEKDGITFERGSSTRSDHYAFEQAGIPVVFFHYSEDPYYHTDEDTIDKIQKEDLKTAGTLAAKLIYKSAKEGKKDKKKGKKVHSKLYKGLEQREKHTVTK
ncbi:DUF4910 domain-containing protein [Hazenella sp. IB182353]|uniref:DUF4910 domain-containing protein n=1 Tax=Polycladospora coralii TaxID=2771432 RepID=UPI00174757CE|nr:DUF4910 domain-containing protein [Polycladospora coralii]MBS7529287.1 DUF4910 domain-containing protein [Polycladospora coralii]